jgi:hypothetical protein
MRKASAAMVTVCLLSGLAGIVAAQQEPAQIVRIYYMTPKPGMEMQFEDGVKKHMAWHAQKKDTWRWDVRFTETGPRSGEYVAVSAPRTWADWDKPVVTSEEDGQNYLQTMAPYVGSWSSILLRVRTDLSRGGEAPATPKFSSVTFYHIKYGQTGKFVNAMRQVREALEKTNAPARSTWFQVVASGRNAIFVVSTPRNSWAEFELTGPSPRERVEQVFGRAAADAIYADLDESVQFTDSKITSYRPDLSFVPATPR